MANHYLFVRCKTAMCPAAIYLLHFEDSEPQPSNFAYPGFSLKHECHICKQTHHYQMKDAEFQSSPTPLHKQGWKQSLPYPHPTLRGKH